MSFRMQLAHSQPYQTECKINRAITQIGRKIIVDADLALELAGRKTGGRLFGCSLPTANRIKQSGKINRAITQVGRKIIVDADLALELAGRKTGGR